jgi:hypothetical protein
VSSSAVDAASFDRDLPMPRLFLSRNSGQETEESTGTACSARLVMLPLLQDWGVGRRTIIIVALMIAVVQWLTMASLSLPAVQRLSLSYYIPYVRRP